MDVFHLFINSCAHKIKRSEKVVVPATKYIYSVHIEFSPSTSICAIISLFYSKIWKYIFVKIMFAVFFKKIFNAKYFFNI